MGYSGRYHAASLAAVFLALAIGILIGVGLGNNVVSDTTKGLEQSLKSDLAAARGRPDDLQGDVETVVGPDSPSGAALGEVAVVREPPNLGAIAAASPKHSEGRKVRRDRAALTGVSRRLGQALAVGGP